MTNNSKGGHIWSKILVLALVSFLIFSMNSAIINGGESCFEDIHVNNENDRMSEVTEIDHNILHASVQLPTETTPPTQLFLQIQDSVVTGYKNLSIEPFESTVQEISSPEIPVGGGTYKLGNAWITDVLPEPRDISGTWTFNIFGKISGTSGNGTLRAEVNSLAKGWLFSAPSTESVAGHNVYHNFTWTFDVWAGTIIPADDRIYVEFWLDAITGGDSWGQTTNPGFDTSNGWTPYDWNGTAYNYERWPGPGNPGWCVEVFVIPPEYDPVPDMNTGGYWEQSFTPVLQPTTASLSFQWKCRFYKGCQNAVFYVFIDTVSGEPNHADAIWSQTVTSTTSWNSIGPIDVSSVVNSTNTYYLKVAFWANNIGTGDYAFGNYDNVLLEWSTFNTEPVFTLGYDNIGTPSNVQPKIEVTTFNQKYLQVQNSTIIGFKNLSTEPFETSIQEIGTPAIPTGGGIYKLGSNWITEVFIGERDLAGFWVFNIFGKISGSTSDGTLRAEVYSLTNGWLFSAPSSESVAGHNTYHNFTWTFDVPVGTTVPHGDRVYIEFWLDATSGGTVSGQTTNPDFDAGVNGWTYHEWLSGGYANGIWEPNSGNPNGAVGVEIIRGWLTWVGDVAGYWQQTFTVSPTPGSATIEFDWRCSEYGLWYGPITFYVFIDTNPGNPNPNNAIWSQAVTSITPWTSVGPIDVSNVVDTATTYYLKIAISAFTIEHDFCKGLFDNVQLFWSTPPAPEFTLGYDHISTPSSITMNLTPDSAPPDHSNESPGINGYTKDTTPEMRVHVTDPSGINVNSIKFYICGYRVFHSLVAIPEGYNVSYWHQTGFSPGEVVPCRIMVEDICGNQLDFSWQFTVLDSYEIQLNKGWNLISVPFIQPDESVNKVLESIDGKWDCIQYYDTFESSWKSYNIYRPNSLNDLQNLDHTLGFWINITEPNVTLDVGGTISTSTIISLYAGWNLVGYPTLNNTITVGEALWGTNADSVMACDISEPYNIKEVGSTYVMKPGEGYWVHVPADTVWVVDW